LILAGQIVVDDHRVDKAGERFSRDVVLRIKGGQGPYVSRGGFKIEKGLQVFPVDPKGRVVMDVGASTGGFTDCLLQRGATKVYAVDVGYGQLAWKLREDPRVVNLERCNIRELTLEQIDEKPSLAVIDASFISLAKVLPATLGFLTEDGWVIALIKPQFEVGRGQVGPGGVVRDESLHRQVVENMRQLVSDLQCTAIGVEESPILGPKGNKEFLICLRKGRPCE